MAWRLGSSPVPFLGGSAIGVGATTAVSVGLGVGRFVRTGLGTGWVDLVSADSPPSTGFSPDS